ncbi:hypothetical protein [Cupriavidus sp. USMAA2-4]|uniref:hypothetical protein n=2 Tax=Cupriavidus TaxID=106589 RepID=UPI0012F50AF0|nr:hypothetical protein [Cupriavidus sp. USMAA2-4]
MRGTESRRWVQAALVALMSSPLSGWGVPPEYAIQLGSSVQYQGNPGGLPESMAGDIHGAAVVANTLGLGLSWPLASPETRLDLAASASDVRYSSSRQLDHQPAFVNSTFYWRAGRLLAGNLHYGYFSQLNGALNQVWPARDMQVNQDASAELGLRVTDELTLPALRVFHATARYDVPYSRQLYNSNQNGWQVSTRYAADPDRADSSAVELGYRRTNAAYPWRSDEQVAIIDNAYSDTEWFSGAQWYVSPKTWIGARASLLQRTYANLSARDTRLVTFNVRALYDFSPKLQFDIRLWRRPYANNTQPQVIYSTQTGGLIGLAWKATSKTTLSLFYQHALQKDYTSSAAISGSDQLRLPAYGARLQWSPTDNMRWMLDFVSTLQRGSYAYDDYNRRYVRLGFEYTFGSRGNQAVRSLLKPSLCGEAYPALTLC